MTSVDPSGPCETCGLYHDSRDGPDAPRIRSGHDQHAHCAAEIARLRESLNSEIAECIRLRKIEEAAREYLDTDGSGALYDAGRMLIARRALRATLGSER